MRKELLIFGLVFILMLCCLVVAVNESGVDDATAAIKGLGENLEGASGFQAKSNEILGNEIQIPENLQFLTRVLFRIEQEINLSAVVTLIAVWIIFFLLFLSTFKLFNFSEAITIGLSVAVTLLLSVIGVVRFFAEFFFGFGNFLSFMEEWEILKLIIFAFIILFIYVILEKILKFAGEKKRVSKASEVGQNVGFAATIGKATREVYNRK